MNKKCIFIGNFFTDKMIEEYSKYCSLSLGNDNYEKNFLLLLNNIFDIVYSFSTPPVPTCSRLFPFSKINGGEETINNIKTAFVSYRNTKLFNTKRVSIKRKVYELLKKEQIDFIFLSTYHHAWMIKELKKRYPNIKIAFLLPDLPKTNVPRKSIFLYHFYKRINKELAKSSPFIDYLLPITEYQSNALTSFRGKVFVYEMFFDSSVFKNIKDSKKKQILYAGNLKEEYGVMDLVYGFLELENPTLFLVVCGRGECENRIKELSSHHHNIQFMGLVSKQEVYTIEKQSLMIVCPDKMDRKYSFHSRYLEYLASGTPVLTYKPSGAKQEYLKYFNYIEDYGNIVNAIREILAKDYDKALQKAEDARIFINEKKNIESFSRELSKFLFD